MADRLYTSSEADEILSALRFETKLEKATLARIAFTLSLVKDGAGVAPSASFSGGEMKRPTFIGEDEVFLHTLIAVSIVWWPFYARLVRGEVARLAARPHVEAAKLAGVSRFRLAGRHLLPGAVPNALVAASLDIGTLPKDKRQRSQNNRLSGSCFSGNNRKARLEVNFETVYQSIIFYV